MTNKNNVGSKIEDLQEDNWRLRYRLDENLRVTFDTEDLYVSHCRTEATIERLRKTAREQETGTRRIDRQLSHVVNELERLSKCVEALREHTRKEGRAYSRVMNQALDLIVVRQCQE